MLHSKQKLRNSLIATNGKRQKSVNPLRAPKTNRKNIWIDSGSESGMTATARDPASSAG
ncbi:hypothetical protein [Candidatus Ruminimicrobiellum ovillum]|uniref:hypothetical protein n=1 Tax=Candidatus Ruminimicrobiellum ovillum TaxID=1947927 RepID=UPI00355A7744